MSEVSGNHRPPVRDRQPKVRSEPKSKPRIAVISTDGPIAICSCGWVSKAAHRAKVRDDRAEAHVNKQHGGSAMWR